MPKTTPARRASNRESQKKFREEKARGGIVPCTVWVPRDRCPELRALAELLCSDRDLMVGPARSIETGRQVSRRQSARVQFLYMGAAWSCTAKTLEALHKAIDADKPIELEQFPDVRQIARAAPGTKPLVGETLRYDR